MIEVGFQVLCANKESACEHVKELINDFENIQDSDTSAPYDHYGKKYFMNILEAKEYRNKIYDLAGEDVKVI